MPRARNRSVAYGFSMGGEQKRFPLDVTGEETAFGFDVAESPSGVRALVVPLGAGLVAVKTRGPDGSVRYAICDERFEPIYLPAKTLEELAERYRRTGRLDE